MDKVVKFYRALKECPTCGKRFVSINRRQVYCSTYCRVKAYRKRKGISEPVFHAKKDERGFMAFLKRLF